MRIKSVEAFWVHIPIPPERQHTSDFGRTLSFDGTLVRIDTECGVTGWGEASLSRPSGLAASGDERCARRSYPTTPRHRARLLLLEPRWGPAHRSRTSASVHATIIRLVKAADKAGGIRERVVAFGPAPIPRPAHGEPIACPEPSRRESVLT